MTETNRNGIIIRNKKSNHTTPTSGEDISMRASFFSGCVGLAVEHTLAIRTHQGSQDDPALLEHRDALAKIREDVVTFLQPDGRRLHDYGTTFDIIVFSRVDSMQGIKPKRRGSKRSKSTST